MRQPSISVTHHTAFDWRARLRAAGIHLVRPVHAVFEYDRFRVVQQAEIPHQAATTDDALAASGRDASRAAYLPLVARKASAYTVLLDAQTAEVLGYLPLDSI
jgi:hypothetical protein